MGGLSAVLGLLTSADPKIQAFLKKIAKKNNSGKLEVKDILDFKPNESLGDDVTISEEAKTAIQAARDELEALPPSTKLEEMGTDSDDAVLDKTDIKAYTEKQALKEAGIPEDRITVKEDGTVGIKTENFDILKEKAGLSKDVKFEDIVSGDDIITLDELNAYCQKNRNAISNSALASKFFGTALQNIAGNIPDITGNIPVPADVAKFLESLKGEYYGGCIFQGYHMRGENAQAGAQYILKFTNGEQTEATLIWADPTSNPKDPQTHEVKLTGKDKEDILKQARDNYISKDTPFWTEQKIDFKKDPSGAPVRDANNNVQNYAAGVNRSQALKSKENLQKILQILSAVLKLWASAYHAGWVPGPKGGYAVNPTR